MVTDVYLDEENEQILIYPFSYVNITTTQHPFTDTEGNTRNGMRFNKVLFTDFKETLEEGGDSVYLYRNTYNGILDVDRSDPEHSKVTWNVNPGYEDKENYMNMVIQGNHKHMQNTNSCIVFKGSAITYLTESADYNEKDPIFVVAKANERQPFDDNNTIHVLPHDKNILEPSIHVYGALKDENGKLVQQDDQGNIVKDITEDDYGNTVITDKYGNYIVVDEYGHEAKVNSVFQYEVLNPDGTSYVDEYGNHVVTNEYSGYLQVFDKDGKQVYFKDGVSVPYEQSEEYDPESEEASSAGSDDKEFISIRKDDFIHELSIIKILVDENGNEIPVNRLYEYIKVDKDGNPININGYHAGIGKDEYFDWYKVIDEEGNEVSDEDLQKANVTFDDFIGYLNTDLMPVKDENNEITSNFMRNHFIVMAKDADVMVDEDTDSKLNKLNGNIVSGDHKGNFMVLVNVFPTSMFAGTYNSAIVTYNVQIDEQVTDLTVNNNEVLQAYKGINMPTPTFKIVDEALRNVKNYYQDHVTATYTSNGNLMGTPKDDAHLLPAATGTVEVTWTLQPKAEYADLYPVVTTTGSININIAKNLPAHLKFYLNGQEINKWQVNTGEGWTKCTREYSKLSDLTYKVTDDYGNDLNSYFPSLTAQNVNLDKSYSDNDSIMLEATGWYQDDVNIVTLNNEATRGHIYLTFDPKTTNGVYSSANGVLEVIIGDTLVVVNPPTAFIAVGQSLWGALGSKEIRKYLPEFLPMNGAAGNSGDTQTPYNFRIRIVKLNEDGTEGEQIHYPLVNHYMSDNGGIKLTARNYHKNHSHMREDWDISPTEQGLYRVYFEINPMKGNNQTGLSERTQVNKAVLVWDINATELLKPEFKISNEHVTVLKGKKFVKPTIILDAGQEFQMDVTEYFNISYKLEYEYKTRYNTYWYEDPTNIDENGFIRDTSKGNRTSYRITLNGTPKVDEDFDYSNSYQAPDARTYYVDVIDEGWNYKLVTNSKDGQRQLVIEPTQHLDVNANITMSAGLSTGLLPGVTVQYGKGGDKMSLFHGQLPGGTDPYYTQGGPAYLDNEGIPTTGGFYRITPNVNGFLYLDAYWREGNRYVATYKDDYGKIYTNEFTPQANGRTKERVRIALHQDYDYYFYNAGSDNANEGMEVYGISFLPAWYFTENDVKTYETATAYLNEYEGEIEDWQYDEETGEFTITKSQGLIKDATTSSLPAIIDHGHDNIEITVAEHATVTDDKGIETVRDVQDYAEREDGYPFYAYYEVGTSWAYPQLNHVTSTSRGANDDINETPRVKVNAHITATEAQEDGTYETYDVGYRLRIISLNAYMVKEGETFNVNQEIKALDGITVTTGGWNVTKEDAYNYGKKDGWGQGELFSTGDYYQTVDGFKFATIGENPPLSERQETFDASKANPYLNPVRGSYLKISPTKKGTLSMYVYQRGNLSWDGYASQDATNNKVNWRPFYVVDESGKGIWMKNVETASLSRGGLKGEEEVYTFDDLPDTPWGLDENNEKFEYDFSGLDDYQKLYTLDIWSPRGEIQNIGSLDTYQMAYEGHGMDMEKTGGFLINYDGYVKYEFTVLPGKTYYMFQPRCMMGLAGFAFDDSEDAELENQGLIQDLTFKASENYEPLYNEDGVRRDYEHVNVTITGKKVVKDEWNSLVLPFSMNEQQVEDVFGIGTEIIHLGKMEARTDAKDGKTYDYIEFIKHYDQSIVSGQPLLIKPTFLGTDGKPTTTLVHNADKDKDYTENLTFRDVAIIEGRDILVDEKPCDNEAEDVYYLKGIYNTVDEVTGAALRAIPKGSYYLSWGNLLQSNYGAKSGAFNAYITASPASAGARMMVMNFEDEVIDETTATRIDAVMDMNDASLNEGIYNLQGQKMKGEDKNLAPGVYIINGKKTVIR